MMDGSLTSKYKRLLVFTSNSPIDDKFHNRPTRIRYYKKYTFLKREIYDAIVEDKLINKAHLEDLTDNINLSNCTIDIVGSVVDEINIQDAPYSTFKDIFNYKQGVVPYSKYQYVDDAWKLICTVNINDGLDPSRKVDNYLQDSVIEVHFNDGDTIIYDARKYVYNTETDEDDTITVKYKLERMLKRYVDM
jgi:hypothetical protein